MNRRSQTITAFFVTSTDHPDGLTVSEAETALRDILNNGPDVGSDTVRIGRDKWVTCRLIAPIKNPVEPPDGFVLNGPSWEWVGPGPQPRKATMPDGTTIYNSYESYASD